MLKFLITRLSLLATLLLIIFSVAHASPLKGSGDPFMKTWVNNDGFNTHRLTIEASYAPGQGYRVTFDMPVSDGYYQSDMCNATSGNTIQCFHGNYGASLVRDDAKHSISVTQYIYKYEYYEPDYLPKLNDVIGRWHTEFHDTDDDNYSSTIKLEVRGGLSNSTVIVGLEASDSRGSQCSSPGGVWYEYNVKTNDDGTEDITLSRVGRLLYGFKYDPHTDQISSLPGVSYNLNDCMSGFIEDNNNPVFARG